MNKLATQVANKGQNFGSISGDNNATYSNVGNNLNISFPKSGFQKIISPDGTVEIHSLNPIQEPDYVNRLNQRIKDLERIISEKDATIKSKDDMICVLKSICSIK